MKEGILRGDDFCLVWRGGGDISNEIFTKDLHFQQTFHLAYFLGFNKKTDSSAVAIRTR